MLAAERRATLLGHERSAACSPRPARTTPAKAEHVILFWNGGGMSHIDTWDPKPGRPTAGEFDADQDQRAGHADLARSSRSSPSRCTTAALDPLDRRHARRSRPGDLPAANQLPAVPEPAAPRHRLGRRARAAATWAICRRTSRSAAWRRGPATSARSAKPTSSAARARRTRTWPSPKASPKSAATSGWKCWRSSTSGSPAGNTDERLTSTQTSIDEAVTLMRSPALEAFEFGKVPAEDARTLRRQRRSAAAACWPSGWSRRACASCRSTAAGSTRTRTPSRRCADHGEVMDPALASLIQDLAESGLLEKTLIIMLSEFGRTPKINKDAGRDHWAGGLQLLHGRRRHQGRHGHRLVRRRRRRAEGPPGARCPTSTPRSATRWASTRTRKS